MTIWTLRQRLDEFYRRLDSAPYAASFEEAMMQIEQNLNDVEDEYSGISYNPPASPLSSTHGRMYAPHEANRHTVPSHPEVTRYRTTQHNVFIGSNGAIEIQTANKVVEFSKKGADGRDVWSLS